LNANVELSFRFWWNSNRRIWLLLSWCWQNASNRIKIGKTISR